MVATIRIDSRCYNARDQYRKMERQLLELGVKFLISYFVGTDPEISRTWLTLSCAAAAVMGHTR